MNFSLADHTVKWGYTNSEVRTSNIGRRGSDMQSSLCNSYTFCIFLKLIWLRNTYESVCARHPELEIWYSGLRRSGSKDGYEIAM